jgi:hypothetical protein
MKEMIMKVTTQNLNRFLIACSVCVILLFLILNIYTPLIADDFYMSVGIHSVGDILNKLYNNYISWGGFALWGFSQLFWLLIGKPYFNIANTIFYCAFIFLVQFHITGKQVKQNPALFLALNIFFWFFVPAWGQDFLWFIGSIGYLWPTVSILFFLVPFRKRQDTPEYKMNMPLSVLFLFAGIFAGGAAANSGAAVLILLIAYFVTKIIKKDRFTLFEILGAVGFLLSFSFLIAAPGNYARAEVVKQSDWGWGYMNDPLLLMLIKRFINITLLLFIRNYGLLFMLISGFFGFELVYKLKRKLPVFSYFYFLAALAGTYSMVLSPTFPDRAFLIVTVFSVITLGNILRQFAVLYHQKQKLQIFKYSYTLTAFISLFISLYYIFFSPGFPDHAFWFIIVLLGIILGNILRQIETPDIVKRNTVILAALVLICLSVSFLNASKKILGVYLRWYDRIEYIHAEKEKGNLEIEVSPIKATDRHVALYGLDDVASYKNFYMNYYIVNYFGLKSIKGNDEPMENLWLEKRKRIRQLIIPPWEIIHELRGQEN